MPRSLVGLLAPATLMAIASAAPIPKEKPADPPDYFPLKIGTRWVYTVVSPKSTSEYAQTVTAVRRGKGKTVGTIETLIDGKPGFTEDYSVSKGGVFREGSARRRLVPPWCEFQYPFKAGSKWRAATEQGHPVMTASFEAHEAEEVTVPAGKYQAVRIESKRVIARADTQITNWYAPSVGLVRHRLVAANDLRTWELKSFTPGKD